MSKDKERLLTLIEKNGNAITVIIGLSKNAGKSTLLNWLLENSKIQNAGVITTGRDGEDFDTLQSYALQNRYSKPKITLPSGTLFTTSSDVLRKEGSSLTIIEKLDFKAAGKELWIVKADFHIETEIVGPPSVKEQIDIAVKLLNYGAQHIFIDGSFDRKAIIAADEVKNVLLAVSPNTGSLDKITERIEYMKLLAEIKEIDQDILQNVLKLRDTPKDPKMKLQHRRTNNLPICPPPTLNSISRNQRVLLITNDNSDHTPLPFDRLIGNEKRLLKYLDNNIKAIYLPTSLTFRSYEIISRLILENKIKIILNHPFNIDLDNYSLRMIVPLLQTVRRIGIDAIAVNSFAVSGSHLDCDTMRFSIRQEVTYPVIDVMESNLTENAGLRSNNERCFN